MKDLKFRVRRKGDFVVGWTNGITKDSPEMGFMNFNPAFATQVRFVGGWNGFVPLDQFEVPVERVAFVFAPSETPGGGNLASVGSYVMELNEGKVEVPVYFQEEPRVGWGFFIPGLFFPTDQVLEAIEKLLMEGALKNTIAGENWRLRKENAELGASLKETERVLAVALDAILASKAYVKSDALARIRMTIYDTVKAINEKHPKLFAKQ